MKVTKLNGREQDFSQDKIFKAISKANNSVGKKLTDEQIQKLTDEIVKKIEKFNNIDVDSIHNLVEKTLVTHKYYEVSKEYITFRDRKTLQKKFDDVDEITMTICDDSNDSLKGDNGNKKMCINLSKRDYIAGTELKSLFNKTMDRDVLKAHKEGKIHWHDSDYFLQPLHNCGLLNLFDMFKHGFLLGDAPIEPPSRLDVGAKLLTQVCNAVSSLQYGGQTVSLTVLAPLVDNTRQRIRQKYINLYNELNLETDIEKINELTERDVNKEIRDAVRTMQYQFITLSNANGQSPFVSMVLNLREATSLQEREDLAKLIYEVIKQRKDGIQDIDNPVKKIYPDFPKLLYWGCEGLNVEEDDPYYYITKLACESIVECMQPDLNSEKKCRQMKEGLVIPSMGCRALLSPYWENTEITEDCNWVWGDDENYYSLEKKSLQSLWNRIILSGNTIFEEDDSTKELKHYKSFTKGMCSVNELGNPTKVLEMHKYIDKINDTTKYVLKVLRPRTYGRWNEGVVTINLPYVALEAKRDNKDFYQLLDERLELCHKALLIRDSYIRKIKVENSPLIWSQGAYMKLKEGQTLDKFMNEHPKYATITLGYVGLFETVYSLIGESNTTPNGQKKSIEILTYINDKLQQWKDKDNLGYALYGTPEESTTFKFAKALQRDFGYIEKITDKDFVVNSYHVDPREEIDAFSKITIESQYLDLSNGGAISYIETTSDAKRNMFAVETLVRFMFDNIYYCEVNLQQGICYKCGQKGFVKLEKNNYGVPEIKCHFCGNMDQEYMYLKARLCGYISTITGGNINKGRADDIASRVVHF